MREKGCACFRWSRNVFSNSSLYLRGGQGSAGQVRSGQVRSGQVRSGQGRSGQGKGWLKEGRAGQGVAQGGQGQGTDGPHGRGRGAGALRAAPASPLHDAVRVLPKDLHLPLVPLRAEVALEPVLVAALLLAHLRGSGRDTRQGGAGLASRAAHRAASRAAQPATSGNRRAAGPLVAAKQQLRQDTQLEAQRSIGGADGGSHSSLAGWPHSHLAVPSQLLQALGFDAVADGLGGQEVCTGQEGSTAVAVAAPGGGPGGSHRCLAHCSLNRTVQPRLYTSCCHNQLGSAQTATVEVHHHRRSTTHHFFPCLRTLTAQTAPLCRYRSRLWDSGARPASGRARSGRGRHKVGIRTAIEDQRRMQGGRQLHPLPAGPPAVRRLPRSPARSSKPAAH